MNNTSSISEDFAEYQRLRSLIEKTNKESPAAADIAELRRALEASPNLWRWAGDVARRASETVMLTYSGQAAFERESIKRGLEVMRDELGYEVATALERMLIEQVLTAWLHVTLLEIVHCEKLTVEHRAEAGMYWDRRLMMAQRRFTRACDSLARVRKLTRATQAHTAQVEAAETARQERLAKPLRALKSA
jgi:hypothetical protein